MRARVAAVLAVGTLVVATRSLALDDEPAPGIQYLKPEIVIQEHLYEGPLAAPYGLWCNQRTGETFVADRITGLVSVFDANGVPVFAFGDDDLREPHKVAVDADDRIYVLDGDVTKVKMYSHRGESLSHVDVKGLKRPPAFTAVAVDPSGDLYLGDSKNGEVLVLDRQHRIRLRLRSGVGPAFSAITGIAFHDGEVYVADEAGLAVQVFDRVGRYVRAWGEHQSGKDGVSLPHGIAVDVRGRVVLIDTLRQEIKVFQNQGQLIGLFGGIGRWPGAVRYPTDTCTDANGRIWVADGGNHRVQVLSVVDQQEDPAELARRAAAAAAALQPRPEPEARDPGPRRPER